MSNTRDRILDEAWKIIERDGSAAATMSAIARAAGITRQALYFHFADRGQLLVALVAHTDDHRGLADWIARIDQAASGRTKVHLLVEMQARRNPSFAALARAIDSARHSEDAAAAAWRSATDDRLAYCERLLVPSLRNDGAIHESWDDREAAIVIWELTSFRVWDDLVNEAALGADRYVAITTHTILTCLSNAPAAVVLPDGSRALRSNSAG